MDERIECAHLQYVALCRFYVIRVRAHQVLEPQETLELFHVIVLKSWELKCTFPIDAAEGRVSVITLV